MNLFFIYTSSDQAANEDKEQHDSNTQKDMAVIAGLFSLLSAAFLLVVNWKWAPAVCFVILLILPQS